MQSEHIFDTTPQAQRAKPLSILYISYPLLAISEASAGGAEQMLLTLEQEMATRGHRTTVAACAGSKISGRLLATGDAAGSPDAFETREREHSERILAYLHQHPNEFDLIHDESGSFFRHADQCPAPVLATLHLPRSFYREEWFCDSPANLLFNCVSQSQARTLSDLPNVISVIQNGIDVDRFTLGREKHNYLLWMGRICEEKAPHRAIAAARKAGMLLVIAGQVYPFSYHRQYFEREIRPMLGHKVAFLESPPIDQKIELLRRSRALLLTSTADETSSLVAMEAMACGTPVIAVRRGAFPEIIVDGETGFVVDDIEEVAVAASRVHEIDPATCRRRAEKEFSAKRMAREYEKLYQYVLDANRGRVAA